VGWSREEGLFLLRLSEKEAEPDAGQKIDEPAKGEMVTGMVMGRLTYLWIGKSV
jgi:hypothetical protein